MATYKITTRKREMPRCEHLLCVDEASDNSYGCIRDCEVTIDGRSKYITAGMARTNVRFIKMKEYLNIRSLGVLLFVLASLFCLYEIYALESEKPHGRRVTKRLKLVSIFSRHGDRSPSDALPAQDRHSEKAEYFWPNGLTNLTDAGRLREFMLGLETRRDYSNYLDYDSSKILALSSPSTRCYESLELFLKGLYNIESTRDYGRSVVKKQNCTHCLPEGPGFPNEWKRVNIDLTTVPVLTWTTLDNCKYRKQNPSPIDADLLVSPEIKSLNGIYLLKDILMKKYNRTFGFSCLNIWSTVLAEMNIARTEETIQYTDHYRDWINLNVSTRGDAFMTLFDLFEQVNLVANRDRIAGKANYIQSGPIITSMIESQMIALNLNVTSDHAPKYKDKKMIIYMTHDTVLQLLFSTLGMIHGEKSYEARFFKLYKRSDATKFLAGLTVSNYGLSVRFELYEEELEGKSDKFATIQATLYNKEDPKHLPIEYTPIEFGSACRRLFLKLYPRAYGELSQFYDPDFVVDQKFSCPFKLFRNVTEQFMIDDKMLDSLCKL